MHSMYRQHCPAGIAERPDGRGSEAAMSGAALTAPRSRRRARCRRRARARSNALPVTCRPSRSRACAAPTKSARTRTPARRARAASRTSPIRSPSPASWPSSAGRRNDHRGDPARHARRHRSSRREQIDRRVRRRPSPSWSTASPSSTRCASAAARKPPRKASARCCWRWRATCA